ncbi:MAG: lamin tail domain-containing protein [Candidatus Nealsonbacteria bacterium]|nr:MAG: lamin tail domain-containing protein [Candidatus Nealsonbacteria bacterium]
MVKKNNIKEIKSYLKKSFVLAITLSIIANFVFGGLVFAKRIKITDKQVEKIKTGLDLMKTLTNFTITEDKLKSILNTTIGIGEVSTNVTYGLLILSALNEMELIDLVVSQRYKTEARNYFNSVLNERLNLINFYTNIGYDIPRVISGAITGPTAALTLNTFSITNKVINIFTVFENIRTVKLYDSLWFYFDMRRNNESHETAWEDAKIVMGWAAKPLLTLRFFNEKKEKNESYIESQFATLFDKWGPHITNHGISEEFKQQAQVELRENLVYAIKKYELVEKEAGPSLFDKTKLSLANLLEGAKNVGSFISDVGKKSQSAIKKGFTRINLATQKLSHFIISFRSGTTAQLEETTEKLTRLDTDNLDEYIKETDSLKELKEQRIESEQKTTLSLEKIQKLLGDISERIDIFSQKENSIKQDIEKLSSIVEKFLEKIKKLENEIKEPEKEKQEEITQEKAEQKEGEQEQETEQILCQKIPSSSPVKDKVIINEIAWMGTVNSANNEWIELKNISGNEINLSGWQLLDKDKKIKIIFNNQHTIQPGGFLLLERTNDDSVPGLSADLIYTGAIGNTNEALYLFDENCHLQDEALAISNWQAGDNSSKKTMERKHNLEWQTSSNIGGTPKMENSSGYYVYYGGEGGGGGGTTPTPPPPPSLPPLKILINEIAWMGTGASPNDEWIELYNTSSTDIDLNNWTLSWSHGTTIHSIIFSTSTATTTTISGNGFYLLERTDDNTTLPDIAADQIYTGALNNKGEKIELRNAKGELIDVVDCSSGWFAGTTTPAYISMERIKADISGIDSTNWASNNLITRNGLDAKGNRINGTPKAENSVSKSETEISSSNILPFSEFEEITLTYLGSPYIINTRLHIPEDKILNVEPEVILKFAPTKLVFVEGCLKAVGKEGKEIIFTSNSNENWAGIMFKSNAPENQKVSQLEFLKIEKAKRCWDSNCTETIIISVYENSISFKDSVFENSSNATIGIWLNNSSSTIDKVSFSDFNTVLNEKYGKAVIIEGGTLGVKNCSFSGNYYGIYITNEANSKIEENIFRNNEKPIYFNAAHPFFRGNSAENNNYNGVLIGTEISTTTLYADLPYIFNNNGSGEGTLTLEPGVIIKLINQKRITIWGKLLARGTPAQPIIFTSLKDDVEGDTNNDGTGTQPASGNWANLYFHSSTTDSILENVIIRYGGTKHPPAGAITLGENVNISIKDSLIEKNIYAVSFLGNIDCQKIYETITQFEAQKTVFVFNDEDEKLTYPVCP